MKHDSLESWSSSCTLPAVLVVGTQMLGPPADASTTPTYAKCTCRCMLALRGGMCTLTNRICSRKHLAKPRGAERAERCALQTMSRVGYFHDDGVAVYASIEAAVLKPHVLK